ncbi:MAG: flagellar basal body-associated FliL family protein [bacterium]
MKKIVIIIAIIALVLIGGIILALKFVTGSNNSKQQEKPVIVSLKKEILTNLANEGNIFHYIKVSVSLEVINSSAAKIVETEMPRIRDEIILVFNGAKVNELSTPAGIERVKERIIQRLNSLLNTKIVRKVLFTDMVVQ